MFITFIMLYICVNNNTKTNIMYTKSEIREELNYLNLTDDEIVMIKNITEDEGCSILEASQIVLD